MPAEYFLEVITKIGGKVKGEGDADKSDKLCADHIPIKKFTITINSPGGVNESQQAVASGRVTLEEVEFEFHSSAASVALFNTICANDPVKQATLSCLKATGDSHATRVYLQWRFVDARITSFKMSGDEAFGIPTDTLKLAYSRIEIRYKKQSITGAIDPTAYVGGFSQTTNAMVTSKLT